MKRIFKTIMVLSVASLSILSSCKKSDDTTTVTDPVKGVISVTSKNTTTGTSRTLANGGFVYGDDSVVVTVTCTGNSSNALKTVTLTSNNSSVTPGISNVAISGTSATKSYAWIVVGTGSITFSSTVTGEKGDPSTSTFTIKITEISTDNPSLGNQAPGSDANRIWSAKTGLTYSLKNVTDTPAIAAKMDLAYCSRSSTNGGNKLISPSSADATAIYSDQWGAVTEKITTWNHRNVTLFKYINNITATDITNANGNAGKTADLIAKAMSTGEPTLDNVPVASGQVYLFKTEAGKYGVIQVQSAEGSATGTSIVAGAAGLVILYQK